MAKSYVQVSILDWIALVETGDLLNAFRDENVNALSILCFWMTFDKSGHYFRLLSLLTAVLQTVLKNCVQQHGTQ